MSLSREALQLLTAHDWPGNVRELKNAIERAVILARPGQEIRAEHLAFLTRQKPGEVILRFAGEPSLEEIERQYLFETLAKYDGNRQKTAAVLGISERHVYRLIEKYGYGAKTMA